MFCYSYLKRDEKKNSLFHSKVEKNFYFFSVWNDTVGWYCWRDFLLYIFYHWEYLNYILCGF